MSTCRYMFYINSQCDYLSTSISPINRHQSHQCDYLSPFDINGKGPFSSWGCSHCLNSLWGCSPYLNAFDLPLNNLSPFEQGISLWCNAENTSNILPLWPSLPLELCLCDLSSNIVLFSRYASDKYLLLESWEEEWLPLRVCLPLSSLQDEQYATIWRSLDLFMHQTCAIPFLLKQNICQQWNRESWTIYTPSASCTKMCPPCTTSMYISHVHQQCAKRYHPWNVSTIFQHVHLPICQHVHLPTCQTMCKYHPWVYHHTSLIAPSKYINHASIS